MTLVVDLSSAWPSMTAAVLKPLGVEGVIAYAGCDLVKKNVSAERVADWRAAGLMVGLVIENFADDLKGGAPVGKYQGQNLARAAGPLGYDLAKYVGYLSADWDVPKTDAAYGAVADACDAARPYLPVLGLYGPGPLLDSLLDRGHIDVAWNSESLSFGAQSARAVLWQHYNDPRAKGNPFDCNDVMNTPLRMWGEPKPTPTPAPTPKEDPMQAVIHKVGDGPDATQQWLFVPEAPAYIPVEDDPERDSWIAAGAIVPKGDANGATISGKVHGLLKSKYGVTS